MKMRYTEVFYSIQGEGRYMGVPSIFLRMFGCNFRCKNFNQPRNVKFEGPNPEVVQIIKNIDQYKTFKDLPLVHSGCDTYASIYPEFKHLATDKQAQELAQEIINLLPHKQWKEEHLVITGGEPLLGWQKAYTELLEVPVMQSLKELTFETNGTQKLLPILKDYLKVWGSSRRKDDITFSVSPKLSISGEKWEEAIKPEIVAEYQDYGYTYLKFVVAEQQDVDEAEEAVRLYRAAGFQGPVYLMPCGGTVEPYQMNATEVAKLAMKIGWRYSDRLQVPLFKNAWGT